MEGTREQRSAELDSRKDADKYAGERDPDQVGDVTNKGVGDDYFTEGDITAEQEEFDRKYSIKSQFDVRYCILGAMGGAIIGTFAAVTDAETISSTDRQYIMKLFMFGTVGGAFLVGLVMVLYLYFNKSAAFHRNIEARREALRRREMNLMEVHHEFVYYDAGRELGRCYRLFCCPHYGKITSERVIYSRVDKRDDFNLFKPKTWLATFTRCWNHDVQSLDYDFVYDVSVDQRFHEFCTDTGTVIIHIKGNADASTQKEERAVLVEALEHDRNLDAEDPVALYNHEKKLRTALLSSRGIVALKGLVDRATHLANQISTKRKEIADKEQKLFVQCYGGHDKGDQANTADLVHVLNVRKPYAVLDDLSYKICKQNKLDPAKRAQMDAQLAEAGFVPDETEGMVGTA
jgi:hypothetical protein